MLKDFLQGFFVTIIFLTIFLSNPAFVYSIDNSQINSTSFSTVYFEEENTFLGNTDNTNDNTNSETDTTNTNDGSSNENNNSSTDSSVSPPSVDSSNYVNSGCTISKLSAKEASDILDITHSGFDGNSMSDGKASDSNGKTPVDLNGLGLIANDNDGKSAIKVVPPTTGTQASRYSVFDGVDITGPWGIGLVLDDTLRVGRCEDLDQESCRIMGDGTSYRTSGVGIKAGFSNAYGALSDLTKRKVAGVSEEDYEKIQNSIFDNDENSLVSYSVEESEKIKNSFKTKNYTAKKSSNCNNTECVISTYSSFDKYFNSWFSVEMIVSSFGPTLVGKAGKLMGIGKAANEGTFWSKTSKFMDNVTDKVRRTPLEAVGLERLNQYKKILNEHPNLRQFFDQETINKKMFSAGQGGYITDMLKKDSALMKLSSEEKAAFFKATDHLRSWIKQRNATVKSLKSTYQKVLADPLATQAEKELAQLDYARSFSNTIMEFDDVINLDFPEWIKESGTLGDFMSLNIKKNAIGTTGADAGIVNLASEGSFNLKNGVMSPFAKKGNWSEYAGKITADSYNVDAAGNLMLFELTDGKLLQQGVRMEDLAKRASQKIGEGTIKIRIPGDPKSYELTDTTVKMLEKYYPNLAAVDLYTSEWVPKMITENGVTRQAVLTPQEFAARISQDRIAGRVNMAEITLDDWVTTLRNQNEFTDRRAWSLYDTQLAKESDFLLDYYKKPFEVGIWKGTVMPIAYWNAKRGFGFEQISGYMLPDKWTNLEVYQGSDRIYSDSYIDFYANEGSDQGDLFMKAISQGIFVWKFMADQFTKEVIPVFYDPITRAAGSAEGIPTGGLSSKSITRDVVGDVAFYSHNENCSGCSGKFAVESDYLSIEGMDLPVAIQAYLVEAVDSETAQEKGTTLIAFSHHSDIKGKTADIEGDKVGLVQARVDGETCEQKLKDIGLGWTNPKAAGLILAGGESLAYAFGGLGGGITATAFQQVIMTRKLQDCIDDLDGYYIHFFSPPSYNKTQSKQAVSNEIIANTISDLSDKFSTSISDTNNPVNNSLQQIGEDFKEFAAQAKNDNILQASIQLFPPSSGGVTGKEVFYVWYKETASPAKYKTDGQFVVKDGNQELVLDFETGETKFNGKTILGSDKADHTRMATTPSDNRIPGIVIPMTLNKVSAPQTTNPVFELYTNGEIKILNEEVLDCIQKAVKDQTGIEYTGNELTSVFGKLNGLSTKLYGKIFVRDGKIMFEGEGPRIEGTGSAKVIVDGYWNTRAIIDSNKQADSGKFEGMTFEHGSIVLKEETNELVIWLRQHKESVLSSKEVAGLKATLDEVIDPNTDCPVPAINLEAIGHSGDELGQQRVKNFNTSIDHLGPFTQFTTDNKIYEFYAKRDGNSGECKDYFRIRDKDSGEIIYDGEIKGGIKQAEDGTLSFETTDGKKHELKFDAENGVPTLTYNGGTPETLRSAQGPNGSFWYDPNTGLWYPENGLQIPLNQAFKDNGTLFASDGKGGVVGTAQNPINLNVGSQGTGGISLPSIPETITGYVLFILSFLMVSYLMTQKSFQKQDQRQKKKK
ncbi:MAG TPA: hypothetical protein PKK60_02505 [archaeon]|nr:hypothetical protein [archaeon]